MVLIHLDDYPRHRLGVSADQRDLLIGHRFRFLAEQFPTARDRDQLLPAIRTLDELHGRSQRTRVTTIRVVLDCALQRAGLCQRADADERGCRRNADSNAPDVRSDAVIARVYLARSIKLLWGKLQRCPEGGGCSAPRRM